MSFIASTSGVKRDGKDLRQDRWLLENFRKNPIFLWSHDYMDRPPIGRATSVGVNGDRLEVDIEFDEGDPFAKEVKRKYEKGFLNAVSVGWQDIKKKGGEIWHEMLDISAVNVPGDPDALALQRKLLARGKMAPVDVVAKEIHKSMINKIDEAIWELNMLALRMTFLQLEEMYKKKG